MKYILLLFFVLPGCHFLPTVTVSPPAAPILSPTASPTVSPTASPTASPLPAFQHYPLLAPQSYGGVYVAQHLLEITTHNQKDQKDQNFTLPVQIEIDADHILILGFTPWQTRAFVLQYDGHKLDFQNFSNRELPFLPALILSDLQQVVWPRLPEQNEWQTGWKVVDTSQPYERRVYFQHQLITHITYHLTAEAQSQSGPPGKTPSYDTVELLNIPFGYQLRITIHRQEPQDE